MRTAKSWVDYRLIDTKDGERLERWGDVILIRPDPQVIWQTPPLTDLWDSSSVRQASSIRDCSRSRRSTGNG